MYLGGLGLTETIFLLKDLGVFLQVFLDGLQRQEGRVIRQSMLGQKLNTPNTSVKINLCSGGSFHFTKQIQITFKCSGNVFFLRLKEREREGKRDQENERD